MHPSNAASTSGDLAARWALAGVGVSSLIAVADAFIIPGPINGSFAAGALIAAVFCPARLTALVGTYAVALSMAAGTWNSNLGDIQWATRAGTCALMSLIAVWIANMAQQRLQALAKSSRMATRSLDVLAAELTGAHTSKEVAGIFAEYAVDILRARAAVVMRLDGDDILRPLAWFGEQPQLNWKYLEVPVPGADSAASATPDPTQWVSRARQAIETVFPTLASTSQEEHTLHVLPLQGGADVRGVLVLCCRQHSPDPGDEVFLQSFAGALASALSRAEQQSQARAIEERNALLVEATLTLTGHLDTASVLNEVGRLIVPRYSDWCAVQLIDEDQLVTAFIEHKNPLYTRRIREKVSAFPKALESGLGATAVVASGVSQVYTYVTEDLVEAAAVNAEHATILRRMEVTSALLAPLTTRSGVIGTLSFMYSDSGRRYTEDDVAFAEQFASRVALALETAAAFEQQSAQLKGIRRVAEAAQRAILAPPPAQVGPIALNARYRSATVEALVGGDMYEVVAMPSSVRLMVGDVRGKGLGAVRTATLALGEFRAAAARADDMPSLAHEIDTRISAYTLGDEEFVTALFLELHFDGSYSVVSCGHPAPVVLSVGASTEVDLDTAPPLGLGCSPKATTGHLRPGDRLLLFTDGLLEARSPSGEFVDTTKIFAAAAADQGSSSLDNITRKLLAHTGGELDDDLALLLATYIPEG